MKNNEIKMNFKIFIRYLPVILNRNQRNFLYNISPYAQFINSFFNSFRMP